jgi:hypothetical protein
MQFLTIANFSTLLAISGYFLTANAKCFNGAYRKGDNFAGDLLELQVAACKAESAGDIAKDGNVWHEPKIDNGKGGQTCLNFGIENISGGPKSINFDTASEGLLREHAGMCSNGGKSEYKDGNLGGWRFM